MKINQFMYGLNIVSNLICVGINLYNHDLRAAAIWSLVILGWACALLESSKK